MAASHGVQCDRAAIVVHAASATSPDTMGATSVSTSIEHRSNVEDGEGRLLPRSPGWGSSLLDATSNLKAKLLDLFTAPGQDMRYTRLRPSPSARAEAQEEEEDALNASRVEQTNLERKRLDHRSNRLDHRNRALLERAKRSHAKLDAYKDGQLARYAELRESLLKREGVVGLSNFQPGMKLEPAVARIRAQELIDMGANREILSAVFADDARAELFHRYSNGLSHTSQAEPSARDVAKWLEQGVLLVWHEPMRPSRGARRVA